MENIKAIPIMLRSDKYTVEYLNNVRFASSILLESNEYLQQLINLGFNKESFLSKNNVKIIIKNN